MASKPKMDSIKTLIAAAPAAASPRADLLLGELRSDYGFPPPTLPPKPPEDAVLVVWEYRICVGDLDAFHGYLAKVEAALTADIKDLKLGAAYYGTYAEAPQFTTHRTYWAYKTPEAVDAFKQALGTKAGRDVLKVLRKLVGFIDCCCSLTMRRYYRAALLANFVESGLSGDPILGLFTGKSTTSKK